MNENPVYINTKTLTYHQTITMVDHGSFGYPIIKGLNDLKCGYAFEIPANVPGSFSRCPHIRTHPSCHHITISQNFMVKASLDEFFLNISGYFDTEPEMKICSNHRRSTHTHMAMLEKTKQIHRFSLKPKITDQKKIQLPKSTWQLLVFSTKFNPCFD